MTARSWPRGKANTLTKEFTGFDWPSKGPPAFFALIVLQPAAHTAYSRNMWPVKGNPLSPYERKFKEGPFPGIRAPFMCLVRF